MYKLFQVTTNLPLVKQLISNVTIDTIDFSYGCITVAMIYPQPAT